MDNITASDAVEFGFEPQRVHQNAPNGGRFFVLVGARTIASRGSRRGWGELPDPAFMHTNSKNDMQFLHTDYLLNVQFLRIEHKFNVQLLRKTLDF